VTQPREYWKTALFAQIDYLTVELGLSTEDTLIDEHWERRYAYLEEDDE